METFEKERARRARGGFLLFSLSPCLSLEQSREPTKCCFYFCTFLSMYTLRSYRCRATYIQFLNLSRKDLIRWDSRYVWYLVLWVSTSTSKVSTVLYFASETATEYVFVYPVIQKHVQRYHCTCQSNQSSLFVHPNAGRWFSVTVHHLLIRRGIFSSQVSSLVVLPLIGCRLLDFIV